MDTEKLIASVYSRKALWDKANSLYHNRDASKEMWQDVCKEIGLDGSAVEMVKKRWNSLRDVFRREYHKVGRQDGSDSTPTWSHYQSMSFLGSQVKTRISINNVDALDSQDSIYDAYISELPLETTMNDVYRPKGKQKRKLSDDVGHTALADSSKKIRVYEPADFQENDESDYHFLMSLLPFLKVVPYKRKLAVRMKLQEVLSEEHDRMEEQSHQE